MLTTASRAYGVADPSEARLMTGREFLQAILDGQLPAPPIAKTLSFWLTEIGDGLAVFEGDAGPHLLNPLGIVHGGWALTLIDSATGCAAHTLIPAGSSYTGAEPVDLFCAGGALKNNNPAQAFQSTLQAAQRGYVPAEEVVGMMYAIGKGVQQDYHEAGKWALSSNSMKGPFGVGFRVLGYSARSAVVTARPCQ